MTMKDDHVKHPKLTRSICGSYHKSEWAIYGTTCSKIESFFKDIERSLSNEFRLHYVDADHSDTESKKSLQIGKKKFSVSGPIFWNEYNDKMWPLNSDAVFVNGNHFPASKQIVFIDPEKKESLKRRVKQLNDIDVVVKDSNHEIYDFLKDKMTGNTQIFSSTELENIVEHIRAQIISAKPVLKALVLAGGKSTRMGLDKSQMTFFSDEKQEIRVAKLCREMGLETFISKSSEYKTSEIEGFSVINDRMLEMGPFGAILSAFMDDPNAAWLVIACDLPYLNENALQKLIIERNVSKVATAFKGKEKEFPEPLITIYEPKAYSKFLDLLSLGYSCPRKVLINSDIETIQLQDDHFIENVNTPEEREKVLSKMKEKA